MCLEEKQRSIPTVSYIYSIVFSMSRTIRCRLPQSKPSLCCHPISTTGFFALLGFDLATYLASAFLFLHLFVKRCTPSWVKDDLSLKGIIVSEA